jgi:hypothetical protein
VKINIQNTLKHPCANTTEGTKVENDKDKNQYRQLQNCKTGGVMPKACANDDQVKTLLKSANPVNACYREHGQNKTLCKINSSCNQNLHEKTTFDKKSFVSQSRYSLIVVIFFQQAFIVCYYVPSC